MHSSYLEACNGCVNFLHDVLILHAFCCLLIIFLKSYFLNSFRNIIRVSNSLEPAPGQHYVQPDLGPNCCNVYYHDNQHTVDSEIFANSIKRHISDLKNSRPWQDLPISIKDRLILPFCKGAKFREIKPLRKFPNLQIPTSRKELTYYPPFMTTGICLCTLVVYIANNINPDQIAPLIAV